jgi:hypothetical protein
MSDSASTGRVASQSESPTPDEEFTIDVMRGETANGDECWAATTASESSLAAGASATAAEAIRRLAIVRTRRRRDWSGDAWVDHTPRPAAGLHTGELQFTVTVTELPEGDEYGRQWTASTEGRSPVTVGYDRTMGTTLRDLARSLSDIPRSIREPSDRPALPEHQADLLLEEGRGLRFRADANARVAACFDRDGRMIGRPKTFVDGEAVGPRQDVEWPDGIELSFDHPGIVYDDLCRQFKAQQNRGETNERQ